jgi:plasmid stabilization system protein ParE
MPVVFRVIVLPEAFENLDSILKFIKQDSPQNAGRTIDRLWEATQTLSQFAHRYKIHQRKRRDRPAVRSMPVRPFIIYYAVEESPPTVKVLAIRHGARKPPLGALLGASSEKT